MLMRRTQTDPSAAVDELTRDLARIRADLDNVRSALTSRGREIARDTTERLGESATSAMRQTGDYARKHPAAATGMGVGLALVIAGIIFGLSQWKR